MIDVALLSVIRRWHLREGMSIREIARRTKLSRNTITKYVASDVVEPRYVRRKSPSQLDAYAAKLVRWLERNAHQGRKHRQTARQMHAALQAHGYTGSYARVTAFVRAWRQSVQEATRTTGRGTFVPLAFAPGEAFQFDWSEDWCVIGGERTEAAGRARSSCATAARSCCAPTRCKRTRCCSTRTPTPSPLFGGVPRRGIYDNMKTAVDRVAHGQGSATSTRASPRWSATICSTPTSATAASGWEKGQIEKNVQDARRRIWHGGAGGFATLAELNVWLAGTLPGAVAGDCRIPSSPIADRPQMWQIEQDAADADAAALRRLRRTHQARLAHLSGPRRAQPL